MNDYYDKCEWSVSQAGITSAGPDATPITAAEAKAHMNIDSDDDDTYIDSLIAAATQYVEKYIGRRLITQTWDLYRRDFPVGSIPLQIPYGPVQSITHIKYLDTAGTLQTWSAANYELDAYALVPKVSPAYGLVWPMPRDFQNAVNIRYVAGYGDAATDVIPNIKHALKMLVQTWFENREDVVVGTIVTDAPNGVKRLLDMERVNWL